MPADPLLDALAQVALDHGALEADIDIGADRSRGGRSTEIAVYYLRLYSEANRKVELPPVIEAEARRLQVVGLQVENGATIITYQVEA